MPNERTDEGMRRERPEKDDDALMPDPHLFHGAEELDDSDFAGTPEAPPADEPPPTGEDLPFEPGHIPSQEEWLGTTSSEEESLDEAAEDEAAGEAARRAPEALRRDED